MANGSKLFLAKSDKSIVAQNTISQISVMKNGSIVDATGKIWTRKGIGVNVSGGRFSGGCLVVGNTGGNNNGISCAANEDFDFGNSNFTVEFWFKPNTKATTCTLIRRGYGEYCPFAIGLRGSDTPYEPKTEGIALQIAFSEDGWAVSQLIPLTLVVGTWYHVALIRMVNSFVLYLNGKAIYRYSNSKSFPKSPNTLDIGVNSFNLNPNCNISDVRISKNVARYLADFDPATTDFSTNGYYYRKDEKWTRLGVPANDSALVDLFKTYGMQDYPTQGQLEELGVGVDRPRRCCLQESATDELPVVKLKAVPKDKLLLPKALVSISDFNDIDSVTVEKIVNGSSAIKFIITTDLLAYKTFNFTSNTWETIDHKNLSTVKTAGIDSESISKITNEKWKSLIEGVDGVGFAILLSQEAVTDDCKLDLLSINIFGGIVEDPSDGSWDKAVHGTDYNYGYPKNNLLRVILLTNGDYKINYREGVKEI
ncbi:LamG-like jellyroll fold domain-containing protein [Anaerosinus massiliensis]|uniref:LamG-like jellyroll fold domain-containing protein n=1 Tax=Massilibacillus massiliensis TaxID=1806837 RepID=UPI000DA60D4B|nr:LamG-like jellyroll fold domain-containing protein [Massilibacillus massiliensis]